MSMCGSFTFQDKPKSVSMTDKVRSAKMQSSYFDPPRKESFATGSTADTVSLYDDLDTPELTAEDEAELMIAIQSKYSTSLECNPTSD